MRTTRNKKNSNLEPTEPKGTPKAAPKKRGLFQKPEAEAAITPPAPEAKKPRARRASKHEPAVEATPEPTEEPAVNASRTRRQRTKSERPAEEAPAKESNRGPARRRTKPTAEFETQDSVGHDLPVPIWRPKESPSKSASVRSESAEHDSGKLAPRRSRGRTRREPGEKPITAADALEQKRPERTRRGRTPRESVAAPEKQAPPKPATRELLPVPSDAPQIVTRDGIVCLAQQGRIIPPIFFFASALDERRVNTVMEELKMAAEAGVQIVSFFLEFEVDPSAVDDSASFAGYLLKKTAEINPNLQVMFRVVFTAPRDWEKRYPDAAYAYADGGSAEPSLYDDAFWGVAEDCLESFIRKVRMLETGSMVLGVHLERGEWFYADGAGYDTSPAARGAFRNWIRMRYRDDIVAVRAAWFDGSLEFDKIDIPPYEQATPAGEEFVRTSRKARKWVDFHLFLSDQIVDRIAKLAYRVKKASDGYFLVAVSYGYTFEWSHPANGHLSLGKLLRTPEVDIIAGPPSYKNREPGGSAPFPGPIDSFALNGKLYISEEDFKTPISGRQEPDDFNPVMKTPQTLENVHWRGVGAALAHQSGVCWMDSWGNGWLNTPGIWQRAEQVRQVLIDRLAAPPSEPDVAVFIDERSLAYLVDQSAFQLLVQNVRESVLRSGLTAGFYLLSDLAHREKFPESKLYIFMNAWDIRPEVRSAIKSRLQRDGKLLFWIYAAGLFDGGRESLERVREVTGIALRPQPFGSKPGTALLNRKHPLCEALPEKLLTGGGSLEPSYFAIPEDGVVLGEYSQTGLPSFVVRDFTSEADSGSHWRSVFLGEPIVTPALFRALGQMAGCHVWNYHEDVVHMRPPFLAVHCSGAGSRTITLPDKWSAYDVTEGHWAATDSTHLRFHVVDGATRLFLVGPQVEIEGLLNLDTDELLKIEEIPERKENTISLESVNFDVPIMKLGEWVEDSWSSEMADDLLLKPSQLEVELEAVEESHRSGRRRKRRRGGSISEESRAPGAPEPDDPSALGLNIVFRKRK